MWPWEHLAVGYLLCSAWFRFRYGRRPRRLDAVAVAVGSQLPDLVDKPLAWGFGFLPSGVSLAHSVLVAVPVSLLVYVLSRRAGRPAVGMAFSIGYLAHLPSDAIYPMLLGGSPKVFVFLWPLVPATSSSTGDILSNVVYYAGRYVDFLLSPAGAPLVVLEVMLIGTALAVWASDGAPGWGWLRSVVARPR